MLTPADRLEILDLCARYNTCTDDKDVDGFMDCWADEVLFESPFGTFDSREALRAFEDEHVNRGMAVGKRHLGLNVSIMDGGEGVAYVTADLMVVEVADAPRIVATVRYNGSKVVKTPKGWRFTHRKLELDPGFMKLMGSAHAA